MLPTLFDGHLNVAWIWLACFQTISVSSVDVFHCFGVNSVVQKLGTTEFFPFLWSPLFNKLYNSLSFLLEALLNKKLRCFTRYLFVFVFLYALFLGSFYSDVFMLVVFHVKPSIVLQFSFLISFSAEFGEFPIIESPGVYPGQFPRPISFWWFLPYFFKYFHFFLLTNLIVF